ncbi:hypothetical protein JCM1841_004230 [Sporobolomyces salmonicolor]
MSPRRFIAFIAAVFLPTLARALLPEDVALVFGANATNLTGSTIDLDMFTLAVVLNETHALVSLNASKYGLGDIGWMGHGQGTSMQNADIVVAWMNPATKASDPTEPWILSHRNAKAPMMPTVAAVSNTTNTTAYFHLVPALCNNDTTSEYLSVAYLRLREFPDDYPTTSGFKNLERDRTNFIYASSSHHPQEAAEAAIIMKHDQAHGALTLDLSLPINLTAGATELPNNNRDGEADITAWTSEAWPASRDGAEGGPLTTRDKFLAAHGAIGSVALLLFSPLAILVGRYCRKLGIPWFRIHASIQIIAYGFIVVAFTLAVTHVRGRHFSNAHAVLGLVIFLILTIQIMLGLGAHKTPATRKADPNGPPRPSDASSAFESLRGKSYVRILHIAVGLGVTITGWAQIRLGLEEWMTYSDSGHEVPTVVIILFWQVSRSRFARLVGRANLIFSLWARCRVLVGVESAEVFLGRFLHEEKSHQAALRSARSSMRSRLTLASIHTRTEGGNDGGAGGGGGAGAGGEAMRRLDTEESAGTQRPGSEGVDRGATAEGMETRQVSRGSLTILEPDFRDRRRESDASTLVGVDTDGEGGEKGKGKEVDDIETEKAKRE